MDVFEIVVPYLSTKNKKTMLTTKVYATSREQVSLFVRQHNIKVYDVNIMDPESFTKDVNESDILNKFIFRSNSDYNDYEIYTTENILADAINYIAEKLSGVSMFGDAIMRTDIPIIDIINRLIEQLKHAAIVDYMLLDDTSVEVKDIQEHIKTFSNKVKDVGYELSDSPSELDVSDYVYESIHGASYMCHCGKPEAITIEGYVEYIASWLTDRVEE